VIARIWHGRTPLEGEVAHFLTLSLWDSMEAIEAFAGADVLKAKYYAEDQGFLPEFEPEVRHYEWRDGA